MSDVDAAKLPVMLSALRLPTIGRLWQEFGAAPTAKAGARPLPRRAVRARAGRARAPGASPAIWPSPVCRTARRFATFDFAAVPTIRKAHVMALAEGDAWLEQGGNLLIFGPSGTGKTHLAAAIGTALVDNGKRVLFTRTTDLVQKLQAARRDLALPATLAKLDRFDCLVLDDLGYVRKDQAETTVLFELIAERYERKSLITTCNQPFSEWNQIFPDPAMTVAAIDRLVHHATILELNTESYRRRAALGKERQPSRLIVVGNWLPNCRQRRHIRRYGDMPWEEPTAAAAPRHPARHRAGDLAPARDRPGASISASCTGSSRPPSAGGILISTSSGSAACATAIQRSASPSSKTTPAASTRPRFGSATSVARPQLPLPLRFR